MMKHPNAFLESQRQLKHPNAFPKSQKLCSKYLIDRLFEQGANKSFSAYPMRLVYRIEEGVGENQLLISVPKRYFKHAVDRNRVKRLVREAYRNGRAALKLPEGKHALLAVLWVDSHHRSQETVAAKLHTLLGRVSEELRVKDAEAEAKE